MASDCVILLHGLARTSSSMSKLEIAIKQHGYEAINVNYPSRKHDIPTLAKEVIPKALSKCPKNHNIHFITHSMGGILVRQYLSTHPIENLNHVVMLGPPNKGSEVVDHIGNVPGFKIINGPAGLQLGSGKSGIPHQLGPADFSLGIIAGTRTINLILSLMLPSPNDGKVSVESTKLEGMTDHIIMPVTHPFMMKNPQVIKQVIHFLKNGMFMKN